MTALEHNNGHVGDGLLKLVPAYWGKPRISALLVGNLLEIQALEDALWTYLDGIDVDTCARLELEGLARIVGEPTRPTDTELLRTRVKGRILANHSDGTAVDICAMVVALAGGPGTLLEFDHEVKVITTTAPPGALELLDATAQGAVATSWLVVPAATAFAWPDHADASPPATGTMGVGVWPDRQE